MSVCETVAPDGKARGTVKVSAATKARLQGLKAHPRETYEDVIDRLIGAAIDDEPLSPETERRLEEATVCIREGRYRPLDDAMRDRGLL